MRLIPAILLALGGGAASALLLLPATAQHGAPASLTEADTGRTITVPRGAVPVVTLEHAAGTGYAWRYADKAGIVPVDARSASAVQAGIVGGPVTQTFQFRVTAPSATVSFTLARSWEKDKPPARTVRYRFVMG